MTNRYALKLGTAISTGALMLGLLAPAAYAAELEISGNGTSSNNNITVTETTTANLTQKNKTSVNMTLNATANTGNNSANNNTGGNTTIDTGNATANVLVVVTGGSNEATLNDCGCPESTDSALISGNGDSSSNNITKTKNRQQ